MAIGGWAEVGYGVRHITWYFGAMVNVLFGCHHRRYSWPQGSGINCYVSCLECGTRFPYDWQEMRRVR
jgi:hypothetical protein